MGIQISGLLSNQPFDWKSVVDQLVAADGIPMKGVQKQQSDNTDKISALTDISGALVALQDSAQAIRSGNPFQNRSVSSDNSASSWKATSTAGAAVGSYKITVNTLATATVAKGGSHIGPYLAPSGDLSTLTVSTLPTATQVTGSDLNNLTFTVNGQQITFTSNDNLKDVLDRITTATGGDVTWNYDNGDGSNGVGNADTIKLTSQGGAPIVLGSPSDNSNFLAVMKLSSSASSSATSSSALGATSLTTKLNAGRLAASITAVDGSGNGSFTINGKSIAYNVNTDTLGSVISTINASGAGVTASYDSSNDRIVLTNKSTGYLNLSLTEASGGLLDALKLTTNGVQSQAPTYGTNAKYSLDGGTNWIYSTSNTLDSSTSGIAGLSVTVNSTGTETLTVDADTNSMTTAIQDLLDKFNSVQDLIETKTKITVNGGSVSTSVLSGNHQVEDWASTLQKLAFASATGLSGSITHLDNLGIDFDGTSGHLVIKDAGKLNTALQNKPEDVQAFFLDGSNGFVPKLYNSLINLTSEDRSQQDSLTKANQALTDQLAQMQTRLDNEREQLTNSFIAMLDAQSAAQSQSTSLTNQFFKSSN